MVQAFYFNNTMTFYDPTANVIGSGIFVSPVGVLQNMGSVGATLILWALMGLYTVGQALCYAELGTVIPKAGGDYTYVYEIFGEVPGFLVVYAHIFLAVASAVGALGLTAAVYILQPLGMDCQTPIIVPMGIFLIGSSPTLQFQFALHLFTWTQRTCFVGFNEIYWHFFF